MNARDLEMIGVYRTATGFRKIIGICKAVQGGVAIDDMNRSEIEYVFCDEKGNDLGNQKPKTCSGKAFANVIIEQIPYSNTIKKEGYTHA